MRMLMLIFKKEFRQIFRNKFMIPIIFVMPLIQLFILANAADYEIDSLRVAVIDNDRGQLSHRMISKFSGSEYFIYSGAVNNYREAERLLDEDEIDLYITIPRGFGQNLSKAKKDELQLVISAIDGQKAGLAMAYSNSLIAGFQKEIMPRGKQRIRIVPAVEITEQYWYNPGLNYKTFMVPGILVMLVTMIGGFLSSMNIVREKEIGTIEQINVTPIKKYHFIAGKLLPFWIIALFELAFGLILALLIYDIPFLGYPVLIFAYAGLYLFVVLGMGLLISTAAETQQQAMFITWFFIVIFILMSGLFTAIENMPEWAQFLTRLNPARYFMEVIRLVMLKGADFYDVATQFGITALYGILLNAAAIMRYRKTV
ncbi:MAG: ABC transporter permease [Bacteroidota bacterium]